MNFIPYPAMTARLFSAHADNTRLIIARASVALFSVRVFIAAVMFLEPARSRQRRFHAFGLA